MQTDYPKSKWQKAVLYWFEDRLAGKPTRRIIVRVRVIADELGTNKRRIVAAIRALESLGYLRSTPRYSDHGGFDASEYLVMPSNPRKKYIVESIAAKINQSPLDALDYLSRWVELSVSGVDVGEMNLRELANALRYSDGTDRPSVLPFVTACKEAGLSLQGDFGW